MATVTFKKGDEYIEKLEQLSRELKREVIGEAVYEGASIVADAVKAGISSIPTESPGAWGTPEKPLRGLNAKQKAGLHNSFGIAPLKDDGDGFLHVKLGFDGYNDIKTKRWPKGQPNAMIARSVERGTSIMKETPFMKKAVAKARNRAREAMKRKVDENIEKIMKG